MHVTLLSVTSSDVDQTLDTNTRETHFSPKILSVIQSFMLIFVKLSIFRYKFLFN